VDGVAGKVVGGAVVGGADAATDTVVVVCMTAVTVDVDAGGTVVAGIRE
jgi:hypothetical protein